MDGSNLIYKCRMCGRIFKGEHVPNGTRVLAIIMSGRLGPEFWEENNFDLTTICNCNSGTMGIADLVGVKEDNIIE